MPNPNKSDPNDPFYSQHRNQYWWNPGADAGGTGAGGSWQVKDSVVPSEAQAKDDALYGRTVVPGQGASGINELQELGYNIAPDFGGRSFRDAAAYQQQVNPYSIANADRSRAAQAALFQQMQQQVAGPSVSDMQARQAMGGNLQAALAASAGGAGAAPVMNRAAGVAGGVAGDSGVARLAEQMRLQQATAGQANAVRGGDLATQQQAMAGQFGANQNEAKRAQLYAALGRMLDEAKARAVLENFKLGASLDASQQLNTADKAKLLASSAASSMR